MIELSMMLSILFRVVGILLCTLIGYLGFSWFKELDIKEKIEIGVKAAEFIHKKISKAGTQKKQYVIDWLNKIGIKISEEKLDAYINAILQEMEKKKKPTDNQSEDGETPEIEEVEGA